MALMLDEPRQLEAVETVEEPPTDPALLEAFAQLARERVHWRWRGPDGWLYVGYTALGWYCTRRLFVHAHPEQPAPPVDPPAVVEARAQLPWSRRRATLRAAQRPSRRQGAHVCCDCIGKR